ncbi:MAG: ankyrin repeat domain-containing protein [Vicinamibacterales bacterium]
MPDRTPTSASTQSSVPKRPDPLAPALVNEFVRKAHSDFPATKALLAETPSLLNATWDWGGGDFEMGIGGAGHMGNREIAEFLISQGGRMDIFVAAMLGELDIVKAMLAAYPGLLHSKGPHGIPLMAHAKKGGTPAEPVVAFLESQGLKS